MGKSSQTKILLQWEESNVHGIYLHEITLKICLMMNTKRYMIIE